METFEDLGAAIGTVEFDRESLIERAVAEGRRRQRRRRVVAGAGVLAVGALAVGTSLYVAGSPGADDTGVASQSTASPGVGRLDLPTAELTDSRLTERLPVAGDLVSATDDNGGVDVRRTLDPDGSGTGTVILALSADQPLTREEVSDSAAKCREIGASSGPESCQRVTGGWMFTLAAQPDPGATSPKTLDWSATVVRKDGTSVAVHATSYVDRRDPTRQAPVLDLDQIEALATDQVWFEPAS